MVVLIYCAHGQVLRAFVKHLLADAGPGAADTKGAIKPAAFVQHYVKWAHQVQKVGCHICHFFGR